MKKYWMGILAGLVIAMLPLGHWIMASFIGPVLPPDSTAGAPRGVTMYTSADTITGDQAVTVLAQAWSPTLPNVPFITGDQLVLSIGTDGANGTVDNFSDGNYSRAGSSNSVSMDHICYTRNNSILVGTDEKSSEQAIDGLVSGVKDNDQIVIVPYGTSCPAYYYDTGWYMAKAYAPTTLGSRDEGIILQITDRDDITGSASASTFSFLIATTRHNSLSEIYDIQAIQSHYDVMNRNVMSSIVIVKDRYGFGVSCSPNSGTNGESFTAAGCTNTRNGYVVPNDKALSLNQSVPTAPNETALYLDYYH